MKLVTFNDIFSCNVEPPSIILVEGSAGTLKSALCFSIVLDILQNIEKTGLYITFEQTWQSHLLNMKSLGLCPTENLLSLDFNIMRKEFKSSEVQVRIFDSILQILSSLKKEKSDGFSIFVLDSLNAVYSIMARRFIEYSVASFFRKLREYNIISLVIYEKTGHNSRSSFKERFLADGIISVGVQHYRGDVIRYLQPLKFASSEHSLKRRHLETGKEGLSLLGPVYL